jgi:MFS family permease
MPDFIISVPRSNRIYRIAIGSLFFMLGLSFATWASRIPSIQQALNLNDTTLGMALFALPVGSMISLPFTSWLIDRFGSKRVAANALFIYSLMLVLLGSVQSLTQLLLVLVLFGAAGNTANISVNTQAVTIEARYGRNIMASFHGLWSLAGFAAAGFGTLMIGENILPSRHFLLISSLIIIGIAASFRYLLPDEKSDVKPRSLFVKPDRRLLVLGIIGFCCMICEGAMFDWSGIYFQRIVGAEKNWVGAGYTVFMFTMATGRFIADWVTFHLGFKKTVQYSGILIVTGLVLAIIFPYLLPALVGFFLVGLGVSSVVPLIYSEAGKSKKMSPGSALAAVSSISFLGFLVGPPLIGIIAGAFDLKISFALIAVMGFSIVFIAAIKNSRSSSETS